MATPFETFITTELPRRASVLTKEMCGGYDGDPNLGPSILQLAPKGTFFLEETGGVLWHKKDPTATSWVELASTDATSFIAAHYRPNQVCTRTDAYNYELPSTPIIGSVTVFFNGMSQDADDYSLASTTITFADPKVVIDKITANYWIT